jgi:hypothetical protein
MSAALRENSATWPTHAFWSLTDCTTSPYHNAWWTLTTVTTPGTYRLQVTTTNLANVNDQKGTSAENMWALRRRLERQRLEERHERHLAQDDDQRQQPVQQLLGDPDDPVAEDVHRPASAGRASRDARRLVEDQVHVRQHDDRHDHLAGLDPGQPGPPGHPLNRRAAVRRTGAPAGTSDD